MKAMYEDKCYTFRLLESEPFEDTPCPTKTRNGHKGQQRKAIIKRRKKNKNKKTHRIWRN